MSLKAALQERFYRWALRGKPPEATPILLTQRRVYVLPTGQGVAFGSMLILMLIGAMNYNLSLGYALVFLLAGLGTMAILHTFRNLVHLSILPGRCPPVFAGETATFGLRLDNSRDAARTAIKLNLPGQSIIEVDIPAAGSTEVPLELAATKRGWLALPRVTLATTWPLGLIRTWSYAAPDLRCLVYPAPASSAPPLPATPGEAGGNTLPAEGMEDFAGLRGHRPADPPRHVAWKVAARQDGAPLQTKLFSGAAAQTLWFDWHTLPAGLDIEQRLSILTRWICDAHTAGIAWGLRLPLIEIAPAADDVHFHACLRQLALYGTP